MKVYISSTSEDLKEYRLRVINKVILSGHDPVCMEFHPAGNTAPKEECLKEVADCNVYIGIFAWRYGFIPPGCEKSITELEYREAVKSGIPTLIFLIDESTDWPEKFKDQDENGEKLKNFRNELLNSKWIRYFHNPDNLASEVLASVSRLNMSMVFIDAQKPTKEDLDYREKEYRKLKEGMTPEEIKCKQLNRCLLPRPIPDRLVRNFKDRETELSKLKQFLSNKNLRMLLVCGREGMGKTSLIAKLLHDLRKLNEDYSSINYAIDSIVFIPLNEKSYQTPERIIELISRTLGPAIGREINEIWNKENASLGERLVEIFSGPLVHHRCLIILDNFESVLDDENRILPELEGLSQFIDICLEYDHSSKVIVTSRRTLTLPHRTEIAAIGRKVQIPLDDGLPENFAIALLRELDPEGLLGLKDAPDELLKNLALRCEFNPLTLESIVSTLQNMPTWTIRTLVENEEFLAKVIENPSREVYASLKSDKHRLVLQVLAVYNEPVPAVAVRSILPALPIEIILDELFRNFVVRHDRGLFWLHPVDRDYAYHQIPDNQPDFSKPEMHNGAAEFYKKLCKPSDSWKSLKDLEPQLKEFHHLVRALQYDEACQLINDIDREHLSTWGCHQQVIEFRTHLVDRIRGCNLAGWNLCHLGTAFMDSGNSSKAKSYYEEALILVSECKDRYLECRVLGNLALAEGQLGDRNKEKWLLEKALSIAEEINDKLHQGRWLGNLTGVMLDLGHINLKKAINDFEQANKIAKGIFDFRFAMIWSERLGEYYNTLQEFDKAATNFLSAFKVSEKINARWQSCRILSKLGSLYRQKGDTGNVLWCYNKVHDIVKGLSNVYQQFNMLIWLAENYEKMSMDALEQMCYEEIWSVIQDIDDRVLKHGLLLYYGEKMEEKDSDAALKAYNMAFEIATLINDKSYLLTNAIKLAKLYYKVRHVDKSINCFESALDIARSLNNRPGEAIVLNEYADMLLNESRAEEAIEYFKPTLHILEELNDEQGLLNVLNRMGMASFCLNDMQGAIKYYERGLLIARETKSGENEAVALFNIGDAYHQIGEIKEAGRCYKKSLEFESQSTNYKCMIGLGICFYHSDQVDTGKVYFEKAIEILIPYKDYPVLFHPYLDALGIALLATGRSEEAFSLYSKCLEHSPPKEHVYYAIQDLLILQRVPQHIEGLADILKTLKAANKSKKDSLQ